MATEVLAPGNTAATSSDIVVTTTPVQLIAKGTGGDPMALNYGLSVEVQTSNSTWLPYGRFTPDNSDRVVLQYPGTYRVRRTAQTASVGVDQT